MNRAVVDVARLPRFAFGPRGIMWWGVLGFLAIETTMLAATLLAYSSFRHSVTEWPPPPVAPPGLGYSTATTALLLASLVPMRLVQLAARRLDLRALIRWHLVCCAVGIAFVVTRVLELTQLHVRWDANAYGSAVWMILGLHSMHLAAEVLETIVITTLLSCGYTEPRYFVDAADNALYWYFIVAIWLPCYATVYFVPRIT